MPLTTNSHFVFVHTAKGSQSLNSTADHEEVLFCWIWPEEKAIFAGTHRLPLPPGRGLHSACALTWAAGGGLETHFLFAQALSFLPFFTLPPPLPSFFLIYDFVNFLLIMGFTELSKTNGNFDLIITESSRLEESSKIT